MSYTTYFHKTNDVNLKISLKWIVFLGTLIAVYCIVEYILGYNPLFSNHFNYRYVFKEFKNFYRVTGTMNHPIPMSTFLCSNVFLSYYLLKTSDRKYFIFVAINCIALLLTWSRSAIIVGFLCIIVLFTLNTIIAIKKELGLREFK